jgi:protein-disulfide isomerase
LVNPVGEHDHVRGASDAKITLVEYGDYECPYCGQAYPIVEQLLATFASDLRLVFRNLPLADVHPHAAAAAEVAEAVGEQGEDKFWAMHDTLYQHQRALGTEALEGYVRDVGADPAAVQVALSSGRASARVEADLEGAIRSGANGTPTFFVNGVRYDESWSYETFEGYLRAVLATPSE